MGNNPNCDNCGLYKTCKNIVMGVGPTPCKIMVLGEAPGADEDEKGEPFVGRSGKLLMSWFEGIGLKRYIDYFITNIVKCRPPQNRDPYPNEILSCKRAWFNDQLKEVNPQLIITVGRFATHSILPVTDPISKVRGHIYKNNKGLAIAPIFHPSYILRGHSDTEVKNDLQLIKEYLASVV